MPPGGIGSNIPEFVTLTKHALGHPDTWTPAAAVAGDSAVDFRGGALVASFFFGLRNPFKLAGKKKRFPT
jgi:hypothetical protein